jgi:hypothetical protein
MISTALQDLFGGKAADAVLLSLFHDGVLLFLSLFIKETRIQEMRI